MKEKGTKPLHVSIERNHDEGETIWRKNMRNMIMTRVVPTGGDMNKLVGIIEGRMTISQALSKEFPSLRVGMTPKLTWSGKRRLSMFLTYTATPTGKR